jgi:hypothetical protein
MVARSTCHFGQQYIATRQATRRAVFARELDAARGQSAASVVVTRRESARCLRLKQRDVIFESDAAAVYRSCQAMECFRRSFHLTTAQQGSAEPQQNVRRQVMLQHDWFARDPLAFGQRLLVMERLERDQSLQRFQPELF